MFQDLTPNFAKLVICSRSGFSMARSFKYRFRFIPRATEGV